MPHGHFPCHVGWVKHEVGDIRSHRFVQAHISPGDVLEDECGRHHLGDGPDLAQHVRVRSRRRRHTGLRCVGYRYHHALSREQSCCLGHNPLELVHPAHPIRHSTGPTPLWVTGRTGHRPACRLKPLWAPPRIVGATTLTGWHFLVSCTDRFNRAFFADDILSGRPGRECGKLVSRRGANDPPNLSGASCNVEGAPNRL